MITTDYYCQGKKKIKLSHPNWQKGQQLDKGRPAIQHPSYLKPELEQRESPCSGIQCINRKFEG